MAEVTSSNLVGPTRKNHADSDSYEHTRANQSNQNPAQVQGKCPREMPMDEWAPEILRGEVYPLLLPPCTAGRRTGVDFPAPEDKSLVTRLG